MSFVKIIKNSVLDEFTGTLSIPDILLSVVFAFLISLFIIYIYKKTYTGVVYSKAFALCIIMLSMVTALIIRTINSNLALSLGMVGALSIVRFRTAVKEPVDTAFMFWGICAGIMTGAGIYTASIAGSLLLGGLFLASYLMGFRTTNRYLLILKFDSKSQEDVVRILKKLPKNKLKSKSIFDGLMELTLEIDLKGTNEMSKASIIDHFENINGVVNASLISYQNDFGE